MAPEPNAVSNVAEEVKPVGMMEATKRLLVDPIVEMMGGDFNTEVSQ